MPTLATGLAVAGGAFPGCMVTIKNRFMWGNGWAPTYSWDGKPGSAASIAGYAAPASAPTCAGTGSGVIAAGSHLIRYRYKNTVTGDVSNPSPATAHVATGAQQCNVSVQASTDARVNSAEVEMTDANGSTFYLAGEFANSTGNKAVNIGDTTLREAVYEWPDTGLDTPVPRGEILCAHRGFLFIGGTPVYNTGTVTVLSTTAAVAVSGGIITTAAVGRYFILSGGTTAFKIATFTSATAFKLNQNFAGATGANKGYRIFDPNCNRVYACTPGYPEAFPATSWRDVLNSKHDTLKSLQSYGTPIIVYGERNMEQWGFQTDPIADDDARVQTISTGHGAVNHRCVIQVDGRVYSMDKQGWHVFTGGVPQRLSSAIDALLPNIAWAYANKFHAVYYLKERQIVWFVCYGTETLPQTGIVLDLDNETPVWSTVHFDQAVTASGNIPDSSGFERPLLGDKNGYLWWYGIGYTDGVYPGTTNEFTAATCSTTTLRGATGLYATGQRLKGVPVYWVDGQETSFVSTNTATVIQLGSAFTTAPALGDSVLLGRIPAVLETKVFNFAGTEFLNLEYYLHLDFEPLSAGTLYVQIKKDYAATAKSDWLTVANQSQGVSMTTASPDIEIDLSKADGHVAIPLGPVWDKNFQFRFEVREPNVPFVLVRYYIQGIVEEREDTP